MNSPFSNNWVDTLVPPPGYMETLAAEMSSSSVSHLTKLCDVLMMNEHRLCIRVLTWGVEGALMFPTTLLPTYPKNIIRNVIKNIPFVL